MAIPDKKTLQIEVAYGQAEVIHAIPLAVAAGTTIAEAIRQSGLLELCPEIDLSENKVGLFSEIRQLDDLVSDGDRIEIYRPLRADPKAVRRKRAAHRKDGK